MGFAILNIEFPFADKLRFQCVSRESRNNEMRKAGFAGLFCLDKEKKSLFMIEQTS